MEQRLIFSCVGVVSLSSTMYASAQPPEIIGFSEQFAEPQQRSGAHASSRSPSTEVFCVGDMKWKADQPARIR
jgi:hypothetical protein